MKIGGFQRFSLSDYPGHVAAIVFTQGCNFRCPFCHNGALIPREAEGGGAVAESLVLEYLGSRVGRLDGVVVTGGEPTLQPDLASFLGKLKSMGYAVKLDTNGSRPGVVRDLLLRGVVDFFAMDVKAPLTRYDRLAGVPVAAERIRESISLIAGSGLPHEFRTTHVPALLDEVDLRGIERLVPHGSPHRVQAFEPEHALDPALRGGRPAAAGELGSA